MVITDAERAELGELIRRERERTFNTKKAAYTEAGVNSNTWDRAEAGEALRPDRLRLVVRCLWPESEGDWSVVLSPRPTGPSRVVALVDAFLEDNPHHDDETIAHAIGAAPQTISSWRKHGLDLPPPEMMRRLADFIGVDYETVVLRAVLFDSGWLKDPPSSGESATA